MSKKFWGPLSHWVSYVKDVAIENYRDYEQFLDANHEKDCFQAKTKELRLLLNAVVAFDNALEYFYYSCNQQFKTKGRLIKYKEFKGLIGMETPEISEIQAISNAFKHCERNRDDAPIKMAADIHNVSFHPYSKLCPETGELMFGGRFSLSFDKNAECLTNAYKFWINHIQPDSLQRQSLLEYCKVILEK